MREGHGGKKSRTERREAEHDDLYCRNGTWEAGRPLVVVVVEGDEGGGVFAVVMVVVVEVKGKGGGGDVSGEVKSIYQLIP